MTDKPTLRQVLLLHEPPHEPSHFDWMLELPVPREHRLVTFRTHRRIDTLLCADLDLPRLPDHRTRYLDYQGLIDDARGSVHRVAAGRVLHIRHAPQAIEAVITWQALPLALTARPLGHDRWRITLRPLDHHDPGTEGFPCNRISGTLPGSADDRGGAMHENENTDPIPLSDIDTPSSADDVQAPRGGDEEQKPKIRAFTQKLFEGKHEDHWNRTPNAPGTGAIHVRSFHCKFNEDSLAHLDQQINEWLDSHPQYEVKLVTTCHGEWKSKFGIEPCLVVQVWV